MSITLETTRTGSPIRSPLVARWVIFTALIVLEGLLLSLRFEVPRFPASCPWWLLPLARSHDLLLPALLGVGVTALLSRFWSRPLPVMEPAAARKQSFPLSGYLLAHLASLAIFVGLMIRVFDGDVLAASWPVAWVIGWYVSGLAVFLTWSFALHPAGWRFMIRSDGVGALAVGGVAALGTLAISQFSEHLWTPMARGTLIIVRFALGLVTTGVVCDPSQYVIGVDDFVVQIAPICSGYEGIGLVWAFLAVYLMVARRTLRWPRAWWLIPLGTVVIWSINSARITTLILIGARISPRIALGGFHSQAGCLGFLATGLGLVALSRRSRFFTKPAAEPTADFALEPVATVNPTAAYLVPFLAVVGTTMITGAVSAGVDMLYPFRIVAGGLALVWFRRVLPGRLFDRSWFAVLAGLIVLGLWVALEPSNPAGAQALADHVARLPTGAALVWLGFRVVGSVVVVPLVEEWAFRGYLTRRLIATDFESVPLGRFTWLSFVLSSLAFGLLHGRWFAGTLAGLIYAIVYYRRGRVGEAALAHAVTNAGIALAVLASQDWTYWS